MANAPDGSPHRYDGASERLASPSSDGFPRPFGQYLLLQVFARGGMGEVYLAKLGGLRGLETYCVVKMLRPNLTRDPEYVRRFLDEARVVVTLAHANIGRVFDVGRVDNDYYLAMEHVAGCDVRTLQDRATARGVVLPAASVLHLVCETLEALDYAHRRRHPVSGEPLHLIHRDVSPQNILVSYEGEVKLIDFGLAASRMKVERTQPNVVMGKMAYMSPEQARGDAIDQRADLFACAVLCYELLAGERYYEGMSPTDIWNIAGVGGFEPRRFRELDPEVMRILAKALHPESHKRFSTCGEFREALLAHVHARFPGSSARGLRTVMSDLFAKEIERERATFAAFGAVTIAHFARDFEHTRSQSISLVRDDSGDPSLLVRDERAHPVTEPSAASEVALAPPRTEAVLFGFATQLSEQDGVVAHEQAAATTDEREAEPPLPHRHSVHDERTVLHDERTAVAQMQDDATQRVRRLKHDDSTVIGAAPTRSAFGLRRQHVLLLALFLACVVLGVAVVTWSADDDRPANGVAVVAAPTNDTTGANAPTPTAHAAAAAPDVAPALAPSKPVVREDRVRSNRREEPRRDEPRRDEPKPRALLETAADGSVVPVGLSPSAKSGSVQWRRQMEQRVRKLVAEGRCVAINNSWSKVPPQNPTERQMSEFERKLTRAEAGECP